MRNYAKIKRTINRLTAPKITCDFHCGLSRHVAAIGWHPRGRGVLRFAPSDGDRGRRRTAHVTACEETPNPGGLMLARTCLTIAALALCCNTPAPSSRSTPASSSPSWSTTMPAVRPIWRRALLSRHIGRHIAGNPRIIVQNMGGAGGIVGTKYLGEIAPRDGSMMGYFTGSTPALRHQPRSASTSTSAPMNSSRCCRAAASISCAPTSGRASRARPTSSRAKTSWSAACSATGRKTWRCG